MVKTQYQYKIFQNPFKIFSAQWLQIRILQRIDSVGKYLKKKILKLLIVEVFVWKMLK